MKFMNSILTKYVNYIKLTYSMRTQCSPAVLENFFEPCVLYLLLKKSSYGYELIKQLSHSCSCPVNTGNLYRGLNRLAGQNAISKRMIQGTIGPKRIMYTITVEGKKLLREWIIDLRRQNKAITLLISRYEHYDSSHSK